jgi:GxxExxY protein
MEVRNDLGPGLLESAYQGCLARELSLRGIRFEREVAVPLVYKGYPLEVSYRMDLVVESAVVVEIKAVDALLPIHQAQLISYLRISGLDTGLLLNFNSLPFRTGIKRVYRPR